MNDTELIVFHINYFEQGQSFERACRLVRDFGGDGMEFRFKPDLSKDENRTYLDTISRAVDKYPLRWIAFGGQVNLMNDDAGMRERGIENAVEFCRYAANRLPLKMVNIFTGLLRNSDPSLRFIDYWHHGSAIVTEWQRGFAVEGMKILVPIADELGIRFVFETHGCYLHDTVDSNLSLIEDIGSASVGMLWDHANLMLFQDCPCPAEVVKKAADRILYVHLKNLLVPPQHFLAVCDLGAGIINIREQVRLLFEAGYRGPWCIESPRLGDREHFAAKDIAYMRKLLSEVLTNQC